MTLPLADERFLFIDVQTSGFSPHRDRILEVAWAIGAAKDESLRIEQSLIEIEPDILTPRIQGITGLTQDDFKTSESEAAVLRRIADSGKIAVAHYAQFEKSFLDSSFKRHDVSNEINFLCTYQIAKRLFPFLPARNIRGLSGYFGVSTVHFKRSRDHVEATWIIWKELVRILADKGILNQELLHGWLDLKKPKTKKKYEYPLPKSKRLELPESPGVYRMLSKAGEVLYVGKATNLRDRVNSYFRGVKGRDRKKLEMLTQTFDLDISVCQSILEASVYESDEIKRYNPPYNVSLKDEGRKLYFYSRDFERVSLSQDEAHPIGPFNSEFAIGQLQMFQQGLLTGEPSPSVFYVEIELSLLRQGLEIFLERHQSLKLKRTLRDCIALGFHLLKRSELEAETETEECEEIRPEKPALNDDESEAPTPAKVADKYERILIRAARAYRRSRDLTRLLNSRIEISSQNERHEMLISNGQLNPWIIKSPETISPWATLGVADYDRMRVLWTELNRLYSRNQDFKICKRASESIRI